jgi:hypothetical protein
MPIRSPDHICSGRECPKVYFSFNLPLLKSGPCARDNTFSIAIHQWMTIIAINILLIDLQPQPQFRLHHQTIGHRQPFWAVHIKYL